LGTVRGEILGFADSRIRLDEEDLSPQKRAVEILSEIRVLHKTLIETLATFIPQMGSVK
jgi:hypothetical protein